MDPPIDRCAVGVRFPLLTVTTLFVPSPTSGSSPPLVLTPIGGPKFTPLSLTAVWRFYEVDLRFSETFHARPLDFARWPLLILQIWFADMRI